MSNEEMKQKLDHAESILKLLQTFDYRMALMETRIYFGELSKTQSNLLKKGKNNNEKFN